MSATLQQFIDVFANCLIQAYSTTSPSAGIGRLLEVIRDCLNSGIANNPTLQNKFHVNEVQGKIFIQVESPLLGYSLTRELADIILLIRCNTKESIVFIQLKNARADLNHIRNRGTDFERIIGHFNPINQQIMYANKGQLLILSGFFERLLYHRHRGSFDNLCVDTFMACNELPTVNYYRRSTDGYLYGGGQRIPMEFVRVTERVVRTLTLYVFSITYNDDLYVLAERSGDLLYLMSRPRYVPYRLATIEQNMWRSIQHRNLSSTIDDVNSPINYLNSDGIRWKVNGITRLRLGRHLREQLRLLLGERNLIDFNRELIASANFYGTSTYIGRALLDLAHNASRTGRFSSASNDIVVRWIPVSNQYVIEDLRIGVHISSQDEYRVEVEDASKSLVIHIH